MVVPDMEKKPQVTEIKVRMDCNGCVRKIKKALRGVTGIYHIYIDSSQQKITITGQTDPKSIVKAIKKTRKNAIICSHTQQSDQQAEPTQPAEAPKEQRQQENPPPKTKPSPESENGRTTGRTNQSSKPKGTQEIHVMDLLGCDGQLKGFHGRSGSEGEPSQPPQSLHVTHRYSTYRQSPYVTGYACPLFPSRSSHYHRQDCYSWNNNNWDITSIFSEENPNACRIL